jgi:hypothetical protein
MGAALLLADEVITDPFNDINKFAVGGAVLVVFLLLLFVVTRFHIYR